MMKERGQQPEVQANIPFNPVKVNAIQVVSELLSREENLHSYTCGVRLSGLLGLGDKHDMLGLFAELTDKHPIDAAAKGEAINEVLGLFPDVLDLDGPRLPGELYFWTEIGKFFDEFRLGETKPMDVAIRFIDLLDETEAGKRIMPKIIEDQDTGPMLDLIDEIRPRRGGDEPDDTDDRPSA